MRLLVLLYLIGFYAAYRAATLQFKSSPFNSTRTHRATLALTLIIAAVAALQYFVPAVQGVLQRDASRVAAGEWWRLLTSLFVQDAGVVGTLFNLISLFLVGSVAEQRWGSRRWLIIFWVGALVGEAVALAWQPVGAGNSVATFALAASIAVACLVARPRVAALACALLALGACAWLLILKDIHGAAALAGAVIGGAMLALERRRDALDSK